MGVVYLETHVLPSAYGVEESFGCVHRLCDSARLVVVKHVGRTVPRDRSAIGCRGRQPGVLRRGGHVGRLMWGTGAGCWGRNLTVRPAGRLRSSRCVSPQQCGARHSPWAMLMARRESPECPVRGSAVWRAD